MVFILFLPIRGGCLGVCLVRGFEVETDLFGASAAFNDFGPKFTCIDANGEQPLTGMIVEVSKVCILVSKLPHFVMYF